MTTINTPQFETADDALFQRQPNLRQRILVVDDDPMIRRLNTDVLIYNGYDVDAAEDGAVAWNAIQENSYDLLVTDHQMPKVTGVDLLKKLHSARLELPVIFATSTFPHEELTDNPWLKIDASLLKPYTVEQLLTTVKNVLSANAPEEQFIAPPNWRGEPLPNRLQF